MNNGLPTIKLAEFFRLPVFMHRQRGTPCMECGANTREGKPYCKAHVDRHPYVANLLARIDQYAADAEIANAGNWRELSPTGPACREVWEFYSFSAHWPHRGIGELTLAGVEACCKALGIPGPAAVRLRRLMERDERRRQRKKGIA